MNLNEKQYETLRNIQKAARLLGVDPDWAAAVCEPQIPSAWSATEITATVNLGSLSGKKAYLFVFDADNIANTVGYTVSLMVTPTSVAGGQFSGGWAR